MPIGRASACACSCDGKGYVFAGRKSDKTYLNDLWEYDPKTDTWTDLGSAPMRERVNATMCSYDGKLYVGLGYGAQRAYVDSAYLQDWWEYNPKTGEWRQLADYPDEYTIACTCFATEGKIYSLYGFRHAFSRDVCCYDVATDEWELWERNLQRAKYNTGGRGALLDGVFYFGGGYNTNNLRYWYAVDITHDKWTPRAAIPGKGREFGACAASKEHVYYFGGRYFGGDLTGGEVFDTYMRFSPAENHWEWCGKMPCGRAENLIAFTIDGKVYFGLGEDEKGVVLPHLYCIEE